MDKLNSFIEKLRVFSKYALIGVALLEAITFFTSKVEKINETEFKDVEIKENKDVDN